MRRHAIALLCPILLGLLVAAPAAAQLPTIQLPAVDAPGQYRLIGPDAGRSDSRCIGRPDTPLCAVETLLACFARREAALCWRVWQPRLAGGELFPGEKRPGYWWSYRVAAAEPAGAGEVVIAVAGRNCGLLLAAPDCVTTPAAPTRYRLRRQPDGGWRVVDWQSPPGRPEALP
ncbi:hypothetical protein [Ferrovibrio xuzhouensis]|uniref:Uncharacterized protein n=1 Tax=Ferrovibrio xuzhouensis TaxID=1576914 RepID=A0ABV7VGR5_9PROT